MLIYNTAQTPVPCRTAIVSACEPALDPAPDADIPALDCFYMRIRDALDFTVDFGPWLQANGNAQLSAAEFSVASDSPATPILGATVFNPAGKCIVLVTPAVAAVVGDAYWIDIEVTVAAVVALAPTDVAIPARTLVRRIHVVIAKG